MNIVEISTNYIEYCYEPCVELELFLSIKVTILEKFTLVSRDLLYSLNISMIVIVEDGKMTVFKGSLRGTWDAFQRF